MIKGVYSSKRHCSPLKILKKKFLMLKYEQYVFKNGLRLVHIPDESLVAHFGVVLGTGSRDELSNEQGIAHFIEHMLFKGTKKRKLYHILSRMEDVGGEIDAYTDKEFIVINSSFPKQYYERAVELIADILFSSTFPDKEIIKEKEVVSEEISMYKDSPAESIFDVFDEILFGDHPMGHNILGTEKTLKKINRTSISNFLNRQVLPQNTVICSAGNISLQNAVKKIEKYFQNFQSDKSIIKRSIPPILDPIQKTVKMRTHQAHCIIGRRSYNASSPYKMGMRLITDLLGGPGMNSRLNLRLREKYGLVYQIDAGYSTFSDCGTFGIYFGTDKSNLSLCQNLIMEEIEKLSREKLGTMQLHNLKRQILGQIIVGSQNKTNVMISAAKSFLMLDRIWTIDQIAQEIEQITNSLLLEIAVEQFLNFEPSIIVFQ